MVVNLAVDGAVVSDADDCTGLHLATDLDGIALRAALRDTGTGEVAPDGGVWLDLGVLRSLAQLASTAQDWGQRWDAMVAEAERAGRLSVDGRTVRVPVH